MQHLARNWCNGIKNPGWPKYPTDTSSYGLKSNPELNKPRFIKPCVWNANPTSMAAIGGFLWAKKWIRHLRMLHKQSTFHPAGRLYHLNPTKRMFFTWRSIQPLTSSRTGLPRNAAGPPKSGSRSGGSSGEVMIKLVQIYTYIYILNNNHYIYIYTLSPLYPHITININLLHNLYNSC